MDAYHPSEGIRVYSAPDPAAPLVEIVGPGMEITPIEGSGTLPGDFVKVTLADGRTGYIRLGDIEFPDAGRADIAVNGNGAPLRSAQGCISSWSVLAVLALLVITGLLALLITSRSQDAGNDFLAMLACFTVVPFFLLVVGFYLAVRSREDRQLEDEL